MSVRIDEVQLQNDSFKEVQKIREELSRISNSLHEKLSPLAGTNGLDLSLYTLRNLERIFRGKGVEKFCPINLSARDIRNALGIDFQLADLLERAFSTNPMVQDLTSLPGMTPEIMARIDESFQLSNGSD